MSIPLRFSSSDNTIRPSLARAPRSGQKLSLTCKAVCADMAPPLSVNQRGSLYEEVFRQTDTAAPARRTGRNLPEFRIPAGREGSKGFYSDIFGREEEGDVRRSRSRSRSKSISKSKSKSNSSSVLSSEEVSPFRPAAADGDKVLFFVVCFEAQVRCCRIPVIAGKKMWSLNDLATTDALIEGGTPLSRFFIHKPDNHLYFEKVVLATRLRPLRRLILSIYSRKTVAAVVQEEESLSGGDLELIFSEETSS
ncbi:hypothetical protein Vadar_026340 [Vaccinium darrowii]|uniref:Uncharacterized protein n=1 Tax=Vaccinium darrowii TaxID=229202 RepID=A0ACB7YZA3_9ERIC|nr:hypothetical protein Vadar_026340 [Vaccinium darrowii]